jgi:hypothetical protein
MSATGSASTWFVDLHSADSEVHWIGAAAFAKESGKIELAQPPELRHGAVLARRSQSQRLVITPRIPGVSRPANFQLRIGALTGQNSRRSGIRPDAQPINAGRLIQLLSERKPAF